jgi:hypothetical protein
MNGGAPTGDGTRGGGVGPARIDVPLVREDTLCVRCTQNLSGMAVDGVCPGCGGKIADSVAVVASARGVEEDQPCLVCGYNLRGLTTDGNCPECGTPVERSLRGALLKYSAPEYVARLHTGLVWAEIGVTISLVSSVLFFLSISAARSVARWQETTQLFALLISGVQLFGWWLFTSRDEAVAGSDESEGARRWARRAVWGLLAVEVGLAAVVWLPAASMRLPITTAGAAAGARLLYMAVSGLVGVGASALAVVALGTYLRAMARRVPSATLKQRAELYRWLVPLLLGLGSLPWFLCCFVPLLPRIAGIVLFYVMVEPWRWELGRIRREQRLKGPSGGGHPPG